MVNGNKAKRLNITAKVKGPLLVGGYSYDPSVDITHAFLLEEENKRVPYIPAKVIRGALREASEILVKSRPDSFKEQTLFSLFGKPDANMPGKLFFEDLLPEQKRENFSIRYGNSINRKLNAVKKDALYNYQFFSGIGERLNGSLFALEELTDEEMKLLKGAGRLLSFIGIGGKKSMGMGDIEVDIEVAPLADKKSIEISSSNVYLLLNAKSFMRISQNKTKEYILDSIEYIPSSTIRGAFASILDKDSELFREIMHLGKVRFSNFYPLGKNATYPYFPLESLFSIKGEEGVDSLYDISIPYIVAKLKGAYYVSDEVEKDGETKRLDRSSLSVSIDGKPAEKNEAKRRYSGHIEISRKLGSVAYEKLWTYKSVFYPAWGGVIKADSKEILKELFDRWFENSDGYLFIGGGSRKGWGRVIFGHCGELKEEVEKAIEKYNKRIRKYVDTKDEFIPIRFLSDAFFSSWEHLVQSFEGSEVFSLFGSTLKREGWHLLFSHPKDKLTALKAGSLIILRGRPKNLDTILVEGVGLFREQSYGMVSIYPGLEVNR